jgi:predicted amidohydrolase YtcJ
MIQHGSKVSGGIRISGLDGKADFRPTYVLILVVWISHLLLRTQDDLEADPVLRGKPIILFRVDMHAVLVSKRVLELCGKLPKTVDGGEIIVDAAGNPTGVFLDNAQLLIPRPAWSVDQMMEFYQRAMTDALSLGLTAIHDAMTIEPMIGLYKKSVVLCFNGFTPFAN